MCSCGLSLAGETFSIATPTNSTFIWCRNQLWIRSSNLFSACWLVVYVGVHLPFTGVYDDGMTWKRFQHHWPFVRGIQWYEVPVYAIFFNASEAALTNIWEMIYMNPPIAQIWAKWHKALIIVCIFYGGTVCTCRNTHGIGNMYPILQKSDLKAHAIPGASQAAIVN